MSYQLFPRVECQSCQREHWLSKLSVSADPGPPSVRQCGKSFHDC